MWDLVKHQNSIQSQQPKTKRKKRKSWIETSELKQMTDLPSDLKPSETPSWESGGTAHILPKERSLATFDTMKLSEVLYGGADGVKKRRFILSMAGNMSKLTGPSKYEMSRAELMETSIADFIDIHKDFALEGYRPSRAEVGWMTEMALSSGPMMPNHSLFISTIIGQASNEQMMVWMPRALTFGMVGCYSQTELSHGSNIRGLQTTAVYDPKTQEFVLNTPTLGATKWWNSNIGCVATHAAVYAQLIIHGKEHGLHVFMVQVRDENHNLLPGIDAGDVGMKVGDNAIDTGYLRLKDVRIPREHLFSKRQHVEPDGTYVSHVKVQSEKGAGLSKRIAYLTMVGARAGMTSVASGRLSRACVIAGRYGVIRHQGFANDNGENQSFTAPEKPILDYQIQRYRVFKQIAICLALRFSGNWMQGRVEKMMEALNTTEISEESMEQLLAEMPEIHATSAGLKACSTIAASNGMEDLRLSLGGHGFLSNAGVGALRNDYCWHVSAEGDFIVLLLQTSKYLINSRNDALKGRKLTGLAECFNVLGEPDFNLSKVQPREPASLQELKSAQFILSMFRYRTLVKTMQVGEKLDKKIAKGMTFHEAWNECAVGLRNAAECHVYYFMARNFDEIIRGVNDEHVAQVLNDLFALFGLQNILEEGTWAGLVPMQLYQRIEEAVESVLDNLRPNTVAIVDAFDIPDRILNSTLGRSDGNVYEALFDAARKANLNQTVPFQGYETVLAPHLDKEFLKLRNRVCEELRQDDQPNSAPAARL